MAAPVVTFISAGNGKVRTMEAVGTWSGYTSLSLKTVTFIEGAASLGEKVSATTIQGYGVTAADWTGEPWDFSVGGADEGEHIVVWLYAYEGWNTLASGGFRIRIVDDLTAAEASVGTWYVGPQSGYIGGWYPYIISPQKDFNDVVAGDWSWTLNGNPAQLAGVDGFGSGWNISSSITGNVDNCFMDVISVGKGYQITNGDAGSTEGKFSDFVTFEENTTSGRFGFLRPVSGIPFARCKFYIGDTGAENTEFIDSGFTVLWEKVTLSDGSSSAVDDGFYELKFQKGSGTTAITMSQGALSAASPHTVVLNFAGSTSASLTGVNVDRGGAITLDSAVTWINSVITNSGQIAVAGAVFTGNSISGYTGAADTSALVWNDADNPAGNLDNCAITMGATATHAIEFGTSAPQTITLNGIDFSGFNASNEENDSTLYFSDTGGNVTWTVNLSGCSGNISYKKARATDTVDLVSNPVELSIHVQDINTTAAIVGARVWIPVTSTASGRPFNQTIDSISAPVGGVSTVTFLAAHNLVTNDYLHISGCDQPEYNKTFQVTKTGATTLEIDVTGSPDASSGTEVGKWVIINDVTDGSGDISASYTYAASQPISGRVRLSSSPYYKTAPISGTVNSSSGLAVTIQMIPDS